MNKFNINFISLEDPENDVLEDEKYEEIKRRFSPEISFIHATINKKGIFPKWFNFVFRSTKAVARIVNQNGIHLIHARSFIPALTGTLAKYFSKRPVKIIYDNRGLYIDEHIYNGRIRKNSVKEKIYRWLENFILKKCDSIVVVSKQFKVHLLSHSIFPVNKIKSKIEVIPNRTRIFFSENEIHAKKSIPGGQIECVYSGSLTDWQGVQLFYNLFESLIKFFPNIRFKILSYEQNLLSNLPENLTGLREKIKVKNVSQDKVAEELVTSNFGLILRKPILSSKVSAPIKLAEYLAAGLPFLVNENIGDTEEIILNHKVGVVIKHGDFDAAAEEIKTLLSDAKIYSRCLTVARAKFNIEDSFKQYENLYDRLLS
jgi:glycosyltransferase involved in cell wall biosynthesis